MTKAIINPDWKEIAVYPKEGAQPQVLSETEKFKVVVGGLEAGQKIPTHPESQGIYIFMEGSGEMMVDVERFPVKAGTIVITPDGANRGMEATTRLSFIAVKIA